jgi:hypothetical protein
MAKLSAAELAVQYGFAAAFFNADKELKRLLSDAVKGQWTTSKFQAKFMASHWYRARSASIRQWTDLTKRDPAEARAKIAGRVAELNDKLTQLGRNLGGINVKQLAEQSLKYAWNDAQLQNVIASYVHYDPKTAAGQVAAYEMQVNAMASDYGVKVNKSTMQDYIKGLVSGKYTQDNLVDVFRDQAKSKYPGMGVYLDKGMSVRQVAAPYVSSYSQIMEVGEDSVQMADPLMQKALQGQVRKAGEPPIMQSVYEFEQSLRKDSRWMQTKNAHNELKDAAMGLGKAWGLVS